MLENARTLLVWLVSAQLLLQASVLDVSAVGKAQS
jgi:hypothetical protein